MRRVLAVAALIAISVLPVLVARDAIGAQEMEHRTASARIGLPFDWPAGEKAADPRRGYAALAKAADSAAVNVVRMTTASRSEGRAGITHYVYLGRPTAALFDQFRLASGRWLSQEESAAGGALVTTVRSESAEGAGGATVVGRPRVLGGGYDLTFAPLAQAYMSLPMAGRYVIDARSYADARAFLDQVGRYLDEVGSDGVVLASGGDPTGGVAGASAGRRYLPYLLVALFVVLVAARAARDGKRVGAMLLLGFPLSRVWLVVTGRLQVAAAAVGAAAAVLVGWRTPGADGRFAGVLAAPLVAGLGACGLLTVAAAAVLVPRIRTADLVKGRAS